MHRSYVHKDWMDLFLSDNQTPLPKEVSLRFFSVVRIKPREEVAVFDGCGREARGTLIQANGAAHFDHVHVYDEKKPSPVITVIQAALEEKKLSETIKRGCEFGVDRFIVFNAERSEPFVFKKIVNKEERVMRIAEDAARQSGRLFIPSIEFKTSLAVVLADEKKSQVFGIYGDVEAETSLFGLLVEKSAPVDGNFLIAVGPEGGLSHKECDMLSKNGFFGVLWSPYVLRSELASLAAVSMVNGFLGRA